MKIKNCYIKLTRHIGFAARGHAKTYRKDNGEVLVDTRINLPRTELGIGRAFVLNFLVQGCGADPEVTDITVECVGIEQRIMNLFVELGCTVKDMTNKPHMETDETGRGTIPGQAPSPNSSLPGETGPTRSVQEYVIDGQMTPNQEGIFNKLEQLNLGDASVRFITGEMSVEEAKQIIAAASTEISNEISIDEEQFKKPKYENNRLPVVQGNTIQEKTENLRNLVQRLPDIMGFSVGALRIPQDPGRPFIGTNENDSLEKELREKLNRKIEIRGNEYKLQQEESLKGSGKYSIAGENDNPIIDPSLTTPDEDYGENAPVRPASTKEKELSSEKACPPKRKLY